VGTWTRGDAGSNGHCTYSASIGSGVSDDGVESTLEDEAHTLGHVTPMRAQQPHVKVMSPAKAHRVKTSTIAKHCGRLCIESAVQFRVIRVKNMAWKGKHRPVLSIFPSLAHYYDTLLVSAAQRDNRPLKA
jgi:hypothetical protein